MASTVHVQGISAQTSEKEVRDFFSFCGKIQSLSVTPESSEPSATQSATVTFEKETAAKTALLLDNTQLGPAQVHVSAASSLGQIAGDKAVGSSDEHHDKEEIAQEDKPRSRIAAEMLAHGYVMSDTAIQKALALDQQHGFSARFTQALSNFDQKYNASGRMQSVDQKYGISTRANEGWKSLNSYYEKAAGTPTGQRLRTFYDQGQKQVMDVHNEARHLAGLKQGKQPEDMAGVPAAGAPATGMPSVEDAEVHKVEIGGVERTKCNCGGVDGKCPCPPGQCACEGCAKAS